MESLYQLEQNRQKAYKRYKTKQDKLRAEKEKIESQLNRLKYPHLITYLNTLGLACVLSKKIKKANAFETFGPFGIGSECSLYIYGDNLKNRNEPTVLASATFKYSGEQVLLVDHDRVNILEITEKMTLDWFVKFAKRNKNF